MAIIVTLVLAMTVVPLIAAVVVRLILGDRVPPLDRRVAICTAGAGLIPAIVLAVSLLALAFPLMMWSVGQGTRAVVPLALGIVAQLLLAVPPPRAASTGTAALARRSALQFAPRRWIWTLIALVALTVTVTVAAGLASRPDDFGNYRMYSATIGDAMTFASEIYGWYFSVPALVTLAILLAITIAALLTIPISGWGEDAEQDAAVRRLRATNVLRAASAAVLVHLSVVLSSLAGTSQLRAVSESSDLGTVEMGTGFAALGPFLYASALVAVAVGLTLFLVTASTAVRTRSRSARS